VAAISKTAFVFFAFSGAVFGQRLDFGFDFGVKGGVPFTDVLKATGVASVPPGTSVINGSITTVNRSGEYLIGPVAELRIPFGFALEVDGIYRGSDYNLTTNNVTTTVDAHAWEIPYLAKFRFPIPLLKPFISAGGAYRTFTDLPNNIVTPTHNAFVLAGGLELRISKLRLSGEARWLRWGEPATNNIVRLIQNQGEILFGVVF
jgi:hypothetical protein